MDNGMLHFMVKFEIISITSGTFFGFQVELLEITWKHLAATDRNPPVSLIKERFCTKLEKDDYGTALTCITNYPIKDLQPFSKSSWLNLFKEKSQRFQKDTLVRLMNAARNAVSNCSMPNPALVCLMEACEEYCFANSVNNLQ